MSNVRRRNRYPPVKLGVSQGVTRADGRRHSSAGQLRARAGLSKLHRTATTGGHAAAGKFISEGVSLLGAARPSAGRSAVAVHGANCSSPSECQNRMGWGTLRLVKHQVNWQSNTKASRRSCVNVWFGKASKSSSSTTPPNPSVKGMAKRLRLLPTPYLER
jgi:hypothetical protein